MMGRTAPYFLLFFFLSDLRKVEIGAWNLNTIHSKAINVGDTHPENNSQWKMCIMYRNENIILLKSMLNRYLSRLRQSLRCDAIYLCHQFYFAAPNGVVYVKKPKVRLFFITAQFVFYDSHFKLGDYEFLLAFCVRSSRVPIANLLHSNAEVNIIICIAH